MRSYGLLKDGILFAHYYMFEIVGILTACPAYHNFNDKSCYCHNLTILR